MALTAKRIERLRKVPGRHSDGTVKGLKLQVTDAGVASWLLRYERAGKERWMGLGPLGEVPHAQARQRAIDARQLLKSGFDPIEHRKATVAKRIAEEAAATAANVTFKECAEQYYRFHSPKWTNLRHSRQFLSSLADHAFPVFGNVPVSAVDKALVLKAIEKIWYRTPETASRVRGRIEAVLDFAKVRGYRGGDNPAAWAGNLEHALPPRNQIAKINHHPSLDYRLVPALMADLDKRQGITPRALEFLILTAARVGEVTGARWDEIDFKQKVWAIPAERMKARREHRVPLSAAALQILKGLPREGEFVFVGASKGKALSNSAMNVLLLKMHRRDITVHGFRSSFSTWAAEQSSYPSAIVELALAHTVDSATAKAYRRTDLVVKRARLMADWSRYCITPARAASNNVTPIRGKA
jgi:integrase